MGSGSQGWGSVFGVGLFLLANRSSTRDSLPEAVAGSSLTTLLTLRALLSKVGMGFPEGLSSPKQWASERGDSVLLAIELLSAGELTKREP